METLRIVDICGVEILSRAAIRRLYDIIKTPAIKLDMSDVSFISRSVADELCNFMEQRPASELINCSHNVAEMLAIVKTGRHQKRKIEKAQSYIISCRSMEELSNALHF